MTVTTRRLVRSAAGTAFVLALAVGCGAGDDQAETPAEQPQQTQQTDDTGASDGGGAADESPAASDGGGAAAADSDLPADADLATTDHRVITSLESRITAIGRDAAGFERQLPQRETELAEAEKNLGQPFKHAHLLTLTREQLATVDQKMAARDDDHAPEEPTEPTLPAAPSTSTPPRQHDSMPARQHWRQPTPANAHGYGR